MFSALRPRVFFFVLLASVLLPLLVPVHASAQRTITGTIMLDGISDLTMINPSAPLGLFTFDLCAKNTALHSIQTAAIVPLPTDHSKGTFTLTNVPVGVFNVVVKGSKWLRSTILGVDTTAGNANAGNVFLYGGDANNDNTVDINDYGILNNAYGDSAMIANSGYDPRADFNCDGIVDIADNEILVNNYATSGDVFATNLQATATTNKVTLKWEGAADATEYRLYRSSEASTLYPDHFSGQFSSVSY